MTQDALEMDPGFAGMDPVCVRDAPRYQAGRAITWGAWKLDVG